MNAGAAFILGDDEEPAQFRAEVELLTTAWAAFKSSPMLIGANPS
jgi:hypothetical protein